LFTKLMNAKSIFRNATIYIGILIVTSGCVQRDSNPITGEYRASWGDTFWELTLTESDKFVFTTDGHFAGPLKTTGYFTRIGDTLYLNSQDTIKWTIKNERYLLIGDTCLIELNTGYDYCKNRINDWCSNKWDIEQLIKIDSCSTWEIWQN